MRGRKACRVRPSMGSDSSASLGRGVSARFGPDAIDIGPEIGPPRPQLLQRGQTADEHGGWR